MYSSFSWPRMKKKNVLFFSNDTEIIKDEKPNTSHVCLYPSTRYLVPICPNILLILKILFPIFEPEWYMICLQQQYSFKAKWASSQPNIAHQHTPLLRAKLFRPQASGASAPRCRACPASRENRVGSTKHRLTATNSSSIYRSK